LALLKSGLSLNEVARRIQCVASSVMRWRNAWRRRGAEALKVGSSPGRPLKLKAAQRRRLLRLLLKGSLAHGYNTNVWTTARIAEVIRLEFGVRYHRDHIGRLMHRLNWSHQKPEKRAIERNDEEIERWKQKEWPRVKKTLRGWAPTSSLLTNPDSY
jgi:transposase